MPAAGPSEQGLKDYLRHVLGNRGTDATPYSDSNKYRIEEQLCELQQVFPTLAIRLSDFHSNDGRLLHLLKADGTIPIHYQGNKYNIPIVVWLTARYPDEAPLAYVVPTATMVIKAGHPHVDRNGQVTCACLRTWNSRQSNLVGLCLEMSHLFGQDPPLFSQPAAAAAAAAAATNAVSATGPAPVSRPPAPSTQLPPGYPPYATPPPPGYPSLYNIPSGPGASGASAVLSGRPGSNISASSGPSINSAAPYSYTGPPGGPSYPAMSSDPSSLAAANPLWGPAFAMSQQAPGGGPSRPPPFPGPPPPGMASSMQGDGIYGPGPYGQTSGYGAPAYGPGPAGRPPGPPPPPPPGITKAELYANFRPLALKALRQQAESAHQAWSSQAVAETNALLEEQRQLSERRAQLQAVVQSLKAEREDTEGLVAEMGNKQAQLGAWLDRNEPKLAAWKEASKNGEQVDWDRVLPPADDMSRLAMETQAADLAAEDAVLVLDKALHAGLSGLTPEVYLKQVRALCRKQFYARAMGLKVAEMQQKAGPVASMSRGGPPISSGLSRPMPVTHGDTWMHPQDAARVAMGQP